jgi:hypothetical protein
MYSSLPYRGSTLRVELGSLLRKLHTGVGRFYTRWWGGGCNLWGVLIKIQHGKRKKT